jgi:hypothetical protein
MHRDAAIDRCRHRLFPQQPADDGVNQKYRSFFRQMHLIADGNIPGGIVDTALKARTTSDRP